MDADLKRTLGHAGYRFTIGGYSAGTWMVYFEFPAGQVSISDAMRRECVEATERSYRECFVLDQYDSEAHGRMGYVVLISNKADGVSDVVKGEEVVKGAGAVTGERWRGQLINEVELQAERDAEGER